VAAHANYHSFGPTSQFRVDANSPQQQGTDRVLASPALYIPNEMPGFCRRMFYSDEWSHKAASPQETILIVKSMRKWIVGALILALAAGLYWRLRPKPRAIGDAYVGEPITTLWSTTAQVRQSVAAMHWGDQVEILARGATQTHVRTLAGVVGWVDSRALLDEALWQRETRLLSQVRSMPLQASGRTKVFTNLRADPGRDAPRIYQLPGGVHVSVLARAVADAPAAPAQASSAPPGSPDEAPKREDWLLVSVASNSASNTESTSSLAPTGSGGDSGQANQAYLVTGNDPEHNQAGTPGQAVPQLAGWVLGRFIDLDLPQTLRDYATSAGMRPVAWFVLNHVSSSSGEKPQYLVAGTHGGEGQPCDFTLLRVYTWGVAKQEYETAFVESDLCGSFPIRVGKQSGTGDAEFRFNGLTEKEPMQERVYVMRQTSVRRVREEKSAPARKSVPPHPH
jgi:hypothetical protein